MSTKLGMSFVILYTLESQPWLNYPDAALTKEQREYNVPRALILNRHDGKYGFPGGSMEEGETPIEAAIRELYEETSISLTIEELQHLCNHTTTSGRVIHCFTHQTDIYTLENYKMQIDKSSHAAEIAGSFLAHLCEYPKGGGYPVLVQNVFSGTAKEELEMLYTTFIKAK